jgi:hypothetical protein
MRPEAARRGARHPDEVMCTRSWAPTMHSGLDTLASATRQTWDDERKGSAFV